MYLWFNHTTFLHQSSTLRYKTKLLKTLFNVLGQCSTLYQEHNLQSMQVLYLCKKSLMFNPFEANEFNLLIV